MLDDEVLDSFPGFHGTAVRLLNDAMRAGEPISITINGEFTLAIPDEEAFQSLLALVGRLETIAKVRERLRYFDEGGKGLSLEEAREAARTRHGIPG